MSNYLSTNREEAVRVRARAARLREEADEIVWNTKDFATADDLSIRADKLELQASILEENPDDIYPLF